MWYVYYVPKAKRRNPDRVANHNQLRVYPCPIIEQHALPIDVSAD
jgi:hypothetical protein